MCSPCTQPFTFPIQMCKAHNCKDPYNKNHVTTAHKCPICLQDGHGFYECKSEKLIKELFEQTKNDIIPEELQCHIEGCQQKHLHTIAGHRCKNCKKFGHGNNCCTLCGEIGHTVSNCIITSLKKAVDNNYITSRVSKIVKKFFEVEDRCYIWIKLGNSHILYENDILYIKKNTSYISTCFMKKEKWNKHLFILRNFLQKQTLFDKTFLWNNFYNNIYVKCPICREENTNKNIDIIKGLATKEPCVICYTNDPDVFFSKCKHVVVCTECYEKLDIYL